MATARTWLHRVTVVGMIIAAGFAWHLHREQRVLAQLRPEHQQVLDALITVRAELARVKTIPPGALIPLEQAFRAVQHVVGQLQGTGVPLEFRTAPRTTLMVATLRLQAIPCRVAIHTETLLPVVETIEALERTQILMQRVMLSANQAAEVEFHIVGPDEAGVAGNDPREVP